MSKSCKCDEKYGVILTKLDAIQNDIKQIQEQAQKQESSGGNIISDFINGKKDEVKNDISSFMLKHCNIKTLDDKTEEQMYEFVIDGLWDLITKKIL